MRGPRGITVGEQPADLIRLTGPAAITFFLIHTSWTHTNGQHHSLRPEIRRRAPFNTKITTLTTQAELASAKSDADRETRRARPNCTTLHCLTRPAFA